MPGEMSADILDRVYDAYTGEMGQQFMRETQRRIHWMCASARGTRLLDVGCSQGLVPILLGREGKSVVGIDTSPSAIRSAEQHLASETSSVRKLVDFIEGDFTTHGFDAPFDCVLMGEVLEHLVHPERFVAQAAQHLAEDGRVVVTVPFGINDHVDHKHTFYLLQPYRLLAKHFDVIEVVLLGKWLGLIGVKRASDASESSSWSDEQLRGLEEAFNRVERDLVDDLSNLRSKLEDANAKYRSSTEEVSRLKREAAHHESERKQAERARSQAEAELSEARGSTERSDVDNNAERAREFEQERAMRHAHEIKLARLEERLNHGAQLRQLELEVRDVEIARLGRARNQIEDELQAITEQLSQERSVAAREAEQLRTAMALLSAEKSELERRLDQGERAALALNATLTEERAESARVKGDLASERASYATERAARDLEHTRLHEQLEAQLGQVGNLTDQQERLAAELQSSNARGVALTDELAKSRDNLATAHEMLRARERDAIALSSAKERIAELEAAHATANVTVRESDQRSDEQRQQELIEQAVRAQQRDFAQVLERQRALYRGVETKAEQLRSDLVAARRSEKQLKAQLDVERRERTSAERRAVQTRNTLSFQLGYELIHGFKSKENFLGLPKSLWHLQQEAARRRRERGSKHEVPIRPLARSAETPTSETLHPPVAVEARRIEAPAASTAPLRSGRLAAELPRELSRLRVACIHDEFTFASFAPECQLQQLTTTNWKRELEDFKPDLLFVESAWRGQDDLWARKIAHRGQELTGIVEWCRSQGVPSVFWNKEDPVHYRTFLNTAKMFDHVFTTDVDCIPRYKRALGHERVYLLPFAVQPKAHNPLEKYQRKDAIAFAGAYYARYPERQVDLATFVENLTHSPRLEIYDRNHGKSDPDYQFPERYRSHIVGTLPFDEIDKAYKGYRYALNLNSIKASQSMFARRVYELLGSNTVTVSNFSRGVRLMFGDLVITTDHGERALAKLQSLAKDDAQSRRFRLAGLRKVLQEHTYGARLRDVAARVWGRDLDSALPHICVLACVKDATEAERIVASFNRQAHAKKQLLLFTTGVLGKTAIPTHPGVECLELSQAHRSNLAQLAPNATHFSAFSSRDHHGPNFLSDLALATLYSPAPVVGKVARYRWMPAAQLQLLEDGTQYRNSSRIKARTALVRRDVLSGVAFAAWLQTLETQHFDGTEGLAIDEFNYCEDGAELAEQQLLAVNDLVIDTGLPLARMLDAANQAQVAARTNAPQQAQIDVKRLAALFKPGPGKPIALTLEGEYLVVQSALADETHEYLYAKEAWAPGELGLPDSGKLHFDATPGLNVQLGVMFLDAKKQRLGHKLCQPGANETLKLPEGTANVQLALRIYGAGTAKIGAVLLDHTQESPELLFGRGDYLLITNRYPSDQDLYRNGFVHRRVLEYRKRGQKVDVFRMTAGQKLSYYEFDDVDVISGGNEALDALLRSNSYKAILVHFLDARMWQSIAPWVGEKRLLLWAHGAEIQAWHRREAHFGPAQLAAAKAESEPRNAFWRNVLNELPEGSKIVFVSRHFADEVLADLNVSLPADRHEVIHNVIDTDLFAYVPKPAEQRTRVLSIRPYTSRIYANDLTVATILALSERPCFTQLEFHLVGDGPLFEETVAPLRHLPNVRLDRRFLTQREIANLHRQYGVFLCPSRGDTQGVSRDEAMSSGLVPITTKAGAIPEFVDAQSGILVECEDVVGLAAGIERLHEDALLFQQLSAQAAQRVRRQSGPQHTTERELALLLAGSTLGGPRETTAP